MERVGEREREREREGTKEGGSREADSRERGRQVGIADDIYLVTKSL